MTNGDTPAAAPPPPWVTPAAPAAPEAFSSSPTPAASTPAPTSASSASSPSPPPASPSLAAPPYAQNVVPAGLTAAAVAKHGPAPLVHHLDARPPAVRHSSLPTQLKRLGYIVSLVLGGGAVLAGVWNIFLLPLLHATFSARLALVAPQRDRWRGMLQRLREIRDGGLYPERTEEEKKEDRALVRISSRASRTSRVSDDEKKKDASPDKKDTKALAPPSPQRPGSPHSATISTADGESVVSLPPVKMHADVTPLSAALKELAGSLDATATTRTSLISTVEGYTSVLHRELFVSRGVSGSAWGVPGSPTSVGLGTLSSNLAKAGGNVTGQTASDGLGLPPAKSEEWDAVRREVRAIKGLLLNRRNFTVPARAH